MHSFTALALATQLLVYNTNAQNNTSNPTESCSDLEVATRWNSSTTRTMQALELIGERPKNPEDPTNLANYYLSNDSSRTWDLSLRSQPQRFSDSSTRNNSTSVRYQQTMFLDTKDSNMTNIGSCHQSHSGAAQVWSFGWSRDALKRSFEEDSGDCTSILGDECIQAIKRNAAREAVNGPFRTASCDSMNNTLPPECSSFGPSETNNTSQMNLTYLDGTERGNANSGFDPSLECQDVNVSSTHSVPVAEFLKDYDNAVRMPVIDIITFWPNLTSGLGVHFDGYENRVHVEVVCMRPDANVAAGSDTAVSGTRLLDEINASFDYLSGGASALSPRAWGGLSAMLISIIFVL